MSTFDTLYNATARATLLSTHGVAATYTAADGTETAVTVLPGDEKTDHENGDQGVGSTTTRTVSVSLDELAAPSANGTTLTLNGVVWDIREVSRTGRGGSSGSGRWADLLLVRSDTTERSHRGYRRNRYG